MTSPAKIKVISLDLHETLVTPAFVFDVWYEGIPRIYAARRGISFEAAKAFIESEYRTVDENSREYFDLNYWSERLDLVGYEAALNYCRDKVAYYPETFEILSSLSKEYPLIISTSMPREFMPLVMEKIEHFFTRVFSSYSDYHQFKTPAFYLTVCREMGIQPFEMLHVGDNWVKDYIMPRGVGIKAIHLNRKGKPGKETITDLRQLKGRIGK